MKRLFFLTLLISVLLIAGCTGKASQPGVPTATQLSVDVVVQTLSAAQKTAALSPSPTAAVPTATLIVPTETALAPTATATPEIAATTTPAAPTATPEIPAPTPTQTVSANLPTPEPSGCEDKAAFYADVTIPDNTSFKQSVEFTKIWQIKNEGTCTWDGYQLIWAGGSAFDAPLSNPVPRTAPGELANISVKMHSPNQGGVYTSLWEFENASHKRFGVNSGGVDLIWARISVTWYPEGSTSPGSSPISEPAGGCAVTRNPAYLEQILSLINAARAQNGLSALTIESRLSAAAQAHSEDMACKNYMDHTGSDGSNWADRVKLTGYKYSYVSENIYAGDPDFGGDAQGAFDWWMNSPVHRSNILSPKITQIGIGFASSPGARYKGRYTLNFARP